MLLYNSGDQRQGDFLLLELSDGMLYLLMRLDGQVYRFPFQGGDDLNDGQEHYFKIERDRRYDVTCCCCCCC